MPVDERVRTHVSFAYDAQTIHEYFTQQDVENCNVTFGIFMCPHDSIIDMSDQVSTYCIADARTAELVMNVSLEDLKEIY